MASYPYIEYDHFTLVDETGPFVMEGLDFRTVRHAYEYYKYEYPGATYKEDKYAEIIRNYKDFEGVVILGNRKLGKSAKLDKIIKSVDAKPRKDFDVVSPNILRRILYFRFYGSKDIGYLLFETGMKRPRMDIPNRPPLGNKEYKSEQILFETRGILLGTYPYEGDANYLLNNTILLSSDVANIQNGWDNIPVNKMIEDKFNVFISLMTEDEIKSSNKFFNYVWGDRIDITKVEDVIFDVYDKKGVQLYYYNLPIQKKDTAINKAVVKLAYAVHRLILEKKYKIVIYSKDGYDRTATIGGVILGLLYPMSSSQVLEALGNAFKSREGKKVCRPSHKRQRDQIRSIVENEEELLELSQEI